MSHKNIYLDHAATTPLDPRVFKTMKPYFLDKFGNASSIHTMGQEARAAVEKARSRVSQFLDSDPSEIIFTSGATESDNLVFKGVINKLVEGGRSFSSMHIITTKIEHPAVLEPCRGLEKKGVEITYLSVDKNGLINISEVEKTIKDKTVLVSIMYVNNEVGTIQPIQEIGKLIKKVKNERASFKKLNLPLIFHTDAVQAVNYCDCRVCELGVDLLSLSAHKIYGPKGVGALYIKKGTPLNSLQVGGHQEFGLRSGTLNTPGIVGLGEAIKLIRQSKEENNRIQTLQEELMEDILKKVPRVVLNGDRKRRIPANINFSFEGLEGESLLLGLDFEGIQVSTGSACSSGSLKPSHVLSAMGISPEVSHGSLRITLGRFTTREEINQVLEVLPKIVERFRKMAPR